MIIAGGVLGLLILVVVIVLVVNGGDKTPQAPVEENTGIENLYKEPSAIQIENLNNSVSDDITNLSSDADFPSDKLSDSNLRL